MTMEAAKTGSPKFTSIKVKTEVKASTYPTIFHGIVYLLKEASTELLKTH